MIHDFSREGKMFVYPLYNVILRELATPPHWLQDKLLKTCTELLQYIETKHLYILIFLSLKINILFFHVLWWVFLHEHIFSCNLMLFFSDYIGATIAWKEKTDIRVSIDLSHFSKNSRVSPYCFEEIWWFNIF